jgi:hypothetical protein
MATSTSERRARGSVPIPTVPALEAGDQLTRDEFERRYAAMPALKKAELIEGVVYMPSPVRVRRHGSPHAKIIGWLISKSTSSGASSNSSSIGSSSAAGVTSRWPRTTAAWCATRPSPACGSTRPPCCEATWPPRSRSSTKGCPRPNTPPSPRGWPLRGPEDSSTGRGGARPRVFGPATDGGEHVRTAAGSSLGIPDSPRTKRPESPGGAPSITDRSHVLPPRDAGSVQRRKTLETLSKTAKPAWSRTGLPTFGHSQPPFPSTPNDGNRLPVGRRCCIPQ